MAARTVKVAISVPKDTWKRLEALRRGVGGTPSCLFLGAGRAVRGTAKIVGRASEVSERAVAKTGHKVGSAVGKAIGKPKTDGKSKGK